MAMLLEDVPPIPVTAKAWVSGRQIVLHDGQHRWRFHSNGTLSRYIEYVENSTEIKRSWEDGRADYDGMDGMPDEKVTGG